MKQNWDLMAGVGGLLGAISIAQVNQFAGLCVTLLLLFVAGLRARREWRNRDGKDEK